MAHPLHQRAERRTRAGLSSIPRPVVDQRQRIQGSPTPPAGSAPQRPRMLPRPRSSSRNLGFESRPTNSIALVGCLARPESAYEQQARTRAGATSVARGFHRLVPGEDADPHALADRPQMGDRDLDRDLDLDPAGFPASVHPNEDDHVVPCVVDLLGLEVELGCPAGRGLIAVPQIPWAWLSAEASRGVAQLLPRSTAWTDSIFSRPVRKDLHLVDDDDARRRGRLSDTDNLTAA